MISNKRFDRFVTRLQDHYESLLADERERVSDLLNRLASRDIQQYRAIVNPPVVEPEPYLYHDDFGFLSEPGEPPEEREFV